MADSIVPWDRGRPARQSLTGFKDTQVRPICCQQMRAGRPRSQCKGIYISLRSNRVEEQGIGRERLAAVLWAEAEEHDASFAYAYFD